MNSPVSFFLYFPPTSFLWKGTSEPPHPTQLSVNYPWVKGLLWKHLHCWREWLLVLQSCLLNGNFKPDVFSHRAEICLSIRQTDRKRCFCGNTCTHHPLVSLLSGRAKFMPQWAGDVFSQTYGEIIYLVCECGAKIFFHPVYPLKDMGMSAQWAQSYICHI